MDLETENRIAAILLKEAAELRRQAQKEGALAYLRQPTVRSRPNSRFLTATVRGVQQANRVVEVNEMWRLRDKQLELENKLRGEKHRSNSRGGYKDDCTSQRSSERGRHEVEASSSGVAKSSGKRISQDCRPSDDEELRDDEIEEFLQSRTKRGRGAVGSRMDETGPYPDLEGHELAEGRWKHRVALGPEKPLFLKSSDTSDDESIEHETRTHFSKHKKHRSKGKTKDKKKDKKRKHKK